mmetsp:Transcript_26254/g.75807  ORF Transcript_26254/g.75807 Transcript_26254/m.75807 type:complete len:316 (-) Transcript_26254:719-1666(-)
MPARRHWIFRIRLARSSAPPRLPLRVRKRLPRRLKRLPRRRRKIWRNPRRRWRTRWRNGRSSSRVPRLCSWRMKMSKWSKPKSGRSSNPCRRSRKSSSRCSPSSSVLRLSSLRSSTTSRSLPGIATGASSIGTMRSLSFMRPMRMMMPMTSLTMRAMMKRRIRMSLPALLLLRRTTARRVRKDLIAMTPWRKITRRTRTTAPVVRARNPTRPLVGNLFLLSPRVRSSSTIQKISRGILPLSKRSAIRLPRMPIWVLSKTTVRRRWTICPRLRIWTRLPSTGTKQDGSMKSSEGCVSRCSWMDSGRFRSSSRRCIR